jgi:hypothetical protein
VCWGDETCYPQLPLWQVRAIEVTVLLYKQVRDAACYAALMQYLVVSACFAGFMAVRVAAFGMLACLSAPLLCI